MSDRHSLCDPHQLSPFADQSNSKSDEELVAEIAGKNEAALRELIARHAIGVAALSRRICFDEFEVNGVVSEVFWELWRRASSFDRRKASVRTYLLTIARSKAIDRRRSAVARERAHQALAANGQRESGDAAHSTEPDKRMLDDEKAAQVRAAINDLPHIQRQAIELAFFDGLTHEEVARRLESPLGTVKTRIRSGLKHLREILAEYAKPESSQ